ncbi:MAG: hypothetical protein A2X88_10890 [Deltaproteobacteria bacterium GWC2_65_14]|nr:MAG: hypothetical protein A2X88_10890 [Deltaproteobacteria bacterium GWC2_65_14]
MRFLLTVFLVLAAPATFAATGEPILRGLKHTKGIRSREQPPNILKEACITYHEDRYPLNDTRNAE